MRSQSTPGFCGRIKGGDMDEAMQRFDEFCRAARSGVVRAVTHGGEGMRLKAAAIALALVAGGAAPAAAQQVAALTRASAPVVTLAPEGAGRVPGDAAREALASMMNHRCRPVSMAASIADRNLECRAVRGVGRESSIEMLSDAEMLGELNGMPVFLSPSERPYVHHMESRGGGGEWVPMLIMSRGMVEQMLRLSIAERKPAMAFLLARERALMRASLDDAADFEGFQYACFVGGDLGAAQAGVNAAVALATADAAPARQAAAKRQAALGEHFNVAREMQAAALGESQRQR